MSTTTEQIRRNVTRLAHAAHGPTLNEQQRDRAVCRMCGQGYAITETYANRAKCPPCAAYMDRLAGGRA